MIRKFSELYLENEYQSFFFGNSMSVETNISTPSVEETSEDILVRGKKTVLNNENLDILNVLKIKASQGSAAPH